MPATRFTIDENVFSQLEGLRIGVVVVRDMDNMRPLDLGGEFAAANAAILKDFEGIELAQYPLVRTWRAVYKGFGEKRNRSSVEALIRRALNGKPVGSINPLVDLYNLLSLTHRFPYGGENLDVMDEDIVLTLAQGDEEFVPLGSTVTEHPKPGEIIYRSGKVVLCGSFNYRESDVTKIMPDTHNVVLFIEDVAGTGKTREDLEKATEDLAQGARDFLGARVRSFIVDEKTPSVSLI